MDKVLASLTLLVFVLPAIIFSLWWTALLAQFYQRVPALDSWETVISGRRAMRALLAIAIVGGWAAIGWAWWNFANQHLDTFGVRQLVEWAIATVRLV